MGTETLTRPDGIPSDVWADAGAVAREWMIEQVRRLGLNSGNSSLPPSSDPPAAAPVKSGRTPSGRKRGGQPGHEKCERSLIPTEECDRVEPLKPSHCRDCGAALSGDDPQPKRKQVVDLPEVKPTVTEYQTHTLTCPCCGCVNAGSLPEHVPRGSFGPRVVAVVTLLSGLGRLSQRMIARLLDDLLGLTISDGQISRLQRIGRESLQPAYEEITADVRESAAVNIDETGWREDGRRAWLWTAVGRLATLFAVRRNRSRAAMHDLLGEDFAGIVTADRFSAYAAVPDERRQFCWAHLLRDFQAMIDRGGKSECIGQRLKDAGQELIHHWNRLRREQIVRTTFDRHYRRLRHDILEALIDSTDGTHSRTAETCRRLSNQCYSLFLFAHADGVSPTNNAAERSLRRAVIFRKLSFGTESTSGSKTLAVVMSVLETCRRLGRDPLACITTAVTHQFQNQPAPTLLGTA
jgi:transposase